MENIQIMKFNVLGRDRYEKIVNESFKEKSRLKPEDLKIITDENYCDICFDGVKLDRDRVFKTKFDMTSYIGDKLLGAIEPKDYQEQIFNNFGLLEWLTALYSSQIMRSKDSSINPITRNWFLIHQRQNVTREFGNMSTENGRHAIQYYLYYYSIYGEKLKLIFGDKINVVSDITENFFAGQEDRFCLHLLNWLDEQAGNIKKDNPDFSWDQIMRKIGLKNKEKKYAARWIWKYIKVIRNRYHPEEMRYELFKEKFESLANQSNLL